MLESNGLVIIITLVCLLVATLVILLNVLARRFCRNKYELILRKIWFKVFWNMFLRYSL